MATAPYGRMGGGYGTTDYQTTQAAVTGEVEPLEIEETTPAPTTPTTTTTRKPKPKPKRRPRNRKRRPKGKRGKGKPKVVKPAPKPKPQIRITTRKPTTRPTMATTITPAPTPAPAPVPVPIPIVQATGPVAGKPPAVQPVKGAIARSQYSASGGGAAQARPEVRVVQPAYQLPVKPVVTTTKSPNQYLYESNSCPKMDVATWENEVVIYDNKHCAIIVRMNPRLRRPTVTFQAPYW